MPPYKMNLTKWCHLGSRMLTFSHVMKTTKTVLILRSHNYSKSWESVTSIEPDFKSILTKTQQGSPKISILTTCKAFNFEILFQFSKKCYFHTFCHHTKHALFESAFFIMFFFHPKTHNYFLYLLPFFPQNSNGNFLSPPFLALYDVKCKPILQMKTHYMFEYCRYIHSLEKRRWKKNYFSWIPWHSSIVCIIKMHSSLPTRYLSWLRNKKFFFDVLILFSSRSPSTLILYCVS
jgi:hypothetical protein